MGQESTSTENAAQDAAQGTETASLTASQTAESAQGQAPGAASGKTFDEVYVKQLRKEAAAARTEAKQATEKLTAITDREKSDSERLTDKLTETTKRATEAESRLLRYEVAADKGLDMDAARFLTGETREEVEARADELSKLLADKATKPNVQSIDGGAREDASETRTPEQAHNDMLLRAMGVKP